MFNLTLSLGTPTAIELSSGSELNQNCFMIITWKTVIFDVKDEKNPWCVRSIQSGDLYSIMSLLIAILNHFR